MSIVEVKQFAEYFRAIHGYAPYSWQERLAARFVAGDWPAAIDLPTGSGKTACIDLAVFAMACAASQPVETRTAPRRVFFCVNRRVIVDEAHDRAQKIAQALLAAEGTTSEAEPSILRRVAAALRGLAGASGEVTAPPLDVLELRGGIYRDNRWARSIVQPTIVCTTIDQLGSRILFHGYGVSDNAAPIQAALVAYDSLILLDEAHISEPFRQSLEQVRSFLDPTRWAKESIGAPKVRVVPMTATPPQGVRQDDVIRLDEKDRENESLDNRLKASKPAELRAVASIVTEAVKAAKRLADGQPTAVGIMVNRVATARDIYLLLRKQLADDANSTVELVIGSMRPADRERQTQRLEPLIGPRRPDISEQTTFVVATQCLEVGADYDFDALVTQCASLDALRQRFGRLNRKGRGVDARAVILAEKRDVKPEEKLDDEKPLDPIYGNAAARTWNWLNAHATDSRIDFGVDAFAAVLRDHGENGHLPAVLLSPSSRRSAPAMLPAYVDMWCQTSPRPTPVPDLGLFLHGESRVDVDVQICFRGDIGRRYTSQDNWCDTVALLPPTSYECMSVPISRVRRWLAGPSSVESPEGDVQGITADDDAAPARAGWRQERRVADDRVGVLWRGKDSILIRSPNDLKPGDTLVLPVDVPDREELGHVPSPLAGPPESDQEHGDETAPQQRIDVAELAFFKMTGRATLRIHPSRASRFHAEGAYQDLLARAQQSDEPPPAQNEWRRLLAEAATQWGGIGDELAETAQRLSEQQNLLVDIYPDQQGVVLTTRRRMSATAAGFLPALDDGDDERSRTRRKHPITLKDHTQHVVTRVEAILDLLPLNRLAAAFHEAARLHDLGKADYRFQAFLRQSDCTRAFLFWLQAFTPLAKSDGMPLTPRQREAARIRAGLPKGFRHEMLSVQLVDGGGDRLSLDELLRELSLHLIASHHGYARPWAPLSPDDDPPDVAVDGWHIEQEERVARPPHRLDSGIADRFWFLNRHFGWWGLAYLEAVLRLADQQASAAEDACEYDHSDSTLLAETTA